MRRRPPRSTRTDTLLPYTTLFRSRDLKQRKYSMEQHRPDLALNLPVKDIQSAHDASFEKARIDPNAWTPRQLLEAARRQGGEGAAEGVDRKSTRLNSSH